MYANWPCSSHVCMPSSLQCKHAPSHCQAYKPCHVCIVPDTCCMHVGGCLSLNTLAGQDSETCEELCCAVVWLGKLSVHECDFSVDNSSAYALPHHRIVRRVGPGLVCVLLMLLLPYRQMAICRVSICYLACINLPALQLCIIKPWTHNMRSSQALLPRFLQQHHSCL